MPLILGANSASGGYNVANSLRYNSGSSDRLTRTPSTSGNLKTWTWSAWIKFSKLATNSTRQYLFSASDNVTDTAGIYYGAYADQTLSFESGAISLNLRASANLFRDVSAWYHIVAVLDTTQATSTNRAKLYVNNTLITSYTSLSNYPSQNADGIINSTGFLHSLGSYYGINHFSDNYLSETYLIDGQALTPSSFGETDFDTGIWKPKAYTGTFGTNGFYLQFKNSASLGTDSSGNGNTFTVNNLTSIDQTTDTPTNNFATMNPLNYTPSAITYTEGNLKLAFPASWNASISSIGVSAGKWYWEAKAVTAGNNIFYGIMTENATTNTATPYTQIGVLCGKTTDGDKYLDTTYTASGFGTSANGDILGFALDLNSGTKNLTITKNGASFTGGSVNLTSNFNSVNVFAFFAGNSSSASAGWEVNYGSPMYAGGSYTDGAGYGNFSYAVPSGYYALCTKNLATFG